jgi:hypothetical protein
MFRLDGAQLIQQRVVRVVTDLGVVEDVVAVTVVLEQLAKLRRAFRGIRRASRPGWTQDSDTSSAAGAISRARS